MELIKLWPYGLRSIVKHPKLGWTELCIHRIEVDENGGYPAGAGYFKTEDGEDVYVSWEGTEIHHAPDEYIEGKTGENLIETFLRLLEATMGVGREQMVSQDDEGWLSVSDI